MNATHYELYRGLKRLGEYPLERQKDLYNRLAGRYASNGQNTPPYIKALFAEIAAGCSSFKFNPNHDELGRFTFGSGGEGDSNTIDDPPIQPVYPIETALMALSGGTVVSAIRYIIGVSARSPVGSAIDNAAQAIEEFLGGKPDRTFQNEAGDTILMRGDKKIRFDINNTYPDSKPHFHIEEQDMNGDWIDIGDQHTYYFNEGE